MPYRRGKKRKKKEKGGMMSFIRLKQCNRSNRVNRPWFTEPDGRTAVQTGPSFFRMEWFLTLNGSWNWTVHGFPDWTVRFGSGLTTLQFVILLKKLEFLFSDVDFVLFCRVLKFNDNKTFLLVLYALLLNKKNYHSLHLLMLLFPILSLFMLIFGIYVPLLL